MVELTWVLDSVGLASQTLPHARVRRRGGCMPWPAGQLPLHWLAMAHRITWLVRFSIAGKKRQHPAYSLLWRRPCAQRLDQRSGARAGDVRLVDEQYARQSLLCAGIEFLVPHTRFRAELMAAFRPCPGRRGHSHPTGDPAPRGHRRFLFGADGGHVAEDDGHVLIRQPAHGLQGCRFNGPSK